MHGMAWRDIKVLALGRGELFLQGNKSWIQGHWGVDIQSYLHLGNAENVNMVFCIIFEQSQDLFASMHVSHNVSHIMYIKSVILSSFRFLRSGKKNQKDMNKFSISISYHILFFIDQKKESQKENHQSPPSALHVKPDIYDCRRKIFPMKNAHEGPPDHRAYRR